MIVRLARPSLALAVLVAALVTVTACPAAGRPVPTYTAAERTATAVARVPTPVVPRLPVGPAPTPAPLPQGEWQGTVVERVCLETTVMGDFPPQLRQAVDEAAVRLLARLGVVSVRAPATCDAAVHVAMVGLGGDRPCNNSMTHPCYNYAGVEGTLELTASGRAPLSVPLHGGYEDCTRCPLEPEGATFEQAWPQALVGGMGQVWGQPLIALGLTDELEEVRLAAVDQAIETGPTPRDAVPNLVAALEDEAGMVRSRAATALGSLAAAGAPSIPALTKALGDDDWLVKQSAVEAMASIGPSSATLLVETLRNSSNREQRLAAVRALAQLGPAAEEAVPFLIAVLEDEGEDTFLRSWAAEALGKVGPAAKAAVPVLIEGLRGSLAGVRDSSARALPAITGQDYGEDADRWKRWWQENGA